MKGLSRYILTLMVICFGCASRDTAENSILKAAIAKYNNALIDAYKNQSLERLREVAVESEVKKVNTIVNSYLQDNQIMEASLHKIDVKEIKIEVDKAIVRTAEDWSYRWINYKTRDEIEPMSDIHYEMNYYLVRKEGKWLVERVEEIKEG